MILPLACIACAPLSASAQRAFAAAGVSPSGGSLPPAQKASAPGFTKSAITTFIETSAAMAEPATATRAAVRKTRTRISLLPPSNGLDQRDGCPHPLLDPVIVAGRQQIARHQPRSHAAGDDARVEPGAERVLARGDPAGGHDLRPGHRPQHRLDELRPAHRAAREHL